jgi:hypothetical protein
VSLIRRLLLETFHLRVKIGIIAALPGGHILVGSRGRWPDSGLASTNQARAE